jgi:hypothetical protein
VWAMGYRPTMAIPYVDVVVPFGGSVTVPDAGNTPRPLISGQEFLDTNGNGIRDAKERALSAGMVYVDANRNGRFNGGELFADLDGQGRFSLLLPGAGRFTLRLVTDDRRLAPSRPLAGQYTVRLKASQVFAKAIFGVTRIARA